jgi:hypothetical protein
MAKVALLLFLSFTTLFASPEGNSTNSAIEVCPNEKLIFAKPYTLDKEIYQSQIIKVTINAIIAEDNYDHIKTDFVGGYGIKRLTDDALWTWDGASNYTLSYYVQIQAKNAKLPDLNTSIFIEDTVLDTTLIKGIKLHATYINHNASYSNLVAESLVINNQKLETYDNEQNIFVLELETEMGNLIDFHLNAIEEQGIDWHKRHLTTDKVFFYGIISNRKSSLSFTYFNTKKSELTKVKIKFDMSNLGQKTSTQIEINPNKEKYPYLKIILYGGGLLFFMILFIWKRSLIYLLLALIILGVAILNLRKIEILVKSDSRVLLLPTPNASSFYTTTAILQTDVLDERSDYIKIQLPDHKIGWVKREDVY